MMSTSLPLRGTAVGAGAAGDSVDLADAAVGEGVAVGAHALSRQQARTSKLGRVVESDRRMIVPSFVATDDQATRRRWPISETS
jgi:hypothetical protein